MANFSGYADRKWDWVVDVGFALHRANSLAPSEVNVMAEQLEPTSDPKADEFIARIKKLGNEPMPSDLNVRADEKRARRVRV